MGLLSKEYSAKTMVPLCRQLATAYDAGIPITRTLDIVGSQQKDKGIRQVLTGMRDAIQNGDTLTGAAHRHEERLSPFFIAVLEAGERGGRLDIMLRDLADYFEDRLALRREVIAAITYPMIQLYAAWWLGNFALQLLGQQFAGANDLLAFIAQYGIWQAQMHLVFAIIALVYILLSRAGLIPYFMGKIALRLWPFGGVVRRFAIARFARSFGMLVASGVPMEKAIAGASAVSGNAEIQEDLNRAIPYVREGRTLAEAFAGSRYLDATAKEMIIVGEESGKLDTQLQKVSQYNMEEARYATQKLVKVLGVLVLLVVAGVVGYVVITFWTNFYGGMLDDLGV